MIDAPARLLERDIGDGCTRDRRERLVVGWLAGSRPPWPARLPGSEHPCPASSPPPCRPTLACRLHRTPLALHGSHNLLL